MGLFDFLKRGGKAPKGPKKDDEKDDRLRVHCRCGKRLKVPLDSVGKRVKCPDCGNYMTVQGPNQRFDL